MKALVQKAKNKPMEWTEFKDPLLKAGLVQLKVKAAALNHRDLWVKKGMYAGITYPMILGSDVAGIVDEVGKDVPAEWVGKSAIVNPSHRWGPDDRHQGPDYKILGMPDFGGFAEILSIPAEYVFPKPEHLTFEQAAALPLAGLTAWRALITRAKAKAQQKVLITGIGGGVALFALQFALALDCEVWVTSSKASKLKAAKSMGAKGGANYREEAWAKSLLAKAGEFDVVIDGAGGPGFKELMGLAGFGARIALYGGTAGNYEGVSPQKIFWKQLSILGSTMGSPTDFQGMLRFVNEKKIVPVIDEIFHYEASDEAFKKLEEGGQFGKLVLSFADEMLS